MKRAVLITGALGEIGHGLIEYFSDNSPEINIVAVDIASPPPDWFAANYSNLTFVTADICDVSLWQRLGAEFDFERIFHLAGVLSTGGEKNPERAHQVNVQGSFGLISFAREQSEKRGRSTIFLFPSTIAAYGIPSIEAKNKAGKIREDQFLTPITIYGANKLYVESLGNYFSEHYKQLLKSAARSKIDFRAIRFPGILSADTVPTGGTSDYGPEILHAAAKGVPYSCFVAEQARLPFIVMPDAVKALIDLSLAPAQQLRQRVFNVGSFSISASEIEIEARKYFPTLRVTYSIDQSRNRIVDSWPADVDDSAARRDWGWNPKYDRARAFAEYMIPGVSKRYGVNGVFSQAAGF